jgi:hypothetical protein
MGKRHAEKRHEKNAPKSFMANYIESRRKVLFVDDDGFSGGHSRCGAATASQSHWDILIADTTVKALAILIEHPSIWRSLM